MRSVLRLPIYTTAAACAALVLAGCGGGGGGGGTTPPTTTSLSLVGSVFNDGSGTGLAGASVQLPSLNLTTTTDAGGNYRFDDIASTFTGGTLQVSATGFDPETVNVTLSGSALQAPAIGLTQAGTPQTVAPATGGTVQQAVSEVPSLPTASLSIPAGSLPAGSSVQITLTPVVNEAVDDLVASLSVASQAVGDTAARRPGIEVRISPRNTVLSSPAQVTLPLPFFVSAGTQVPIIQKKNDVWREVGTAIVNAGGASATGPISEFQPTGIEAWHSFQRTPTTQSTVTLEEVTLASIQNNIHNLPDRRYVVNRTIDPGRVARITARFKMGFQTPTLPTTPVDEAALVLGRAAHRDHLADRFASGLWNIAGGPVTYALREDAIVVRRVLDGQVRDNAGSFTTTHGKPSWPRPSDHNQGGVQ